VKESIMPRHFNYRIIPVASFALAIVPSASPARAQPAALTFNAKSKVAIVLPQTTTLPEQTAARDLDEYLTKITGGDFIVTQEPIKPTSPAIYVGNTSFAKTAGIAVNALASEEWRMKSQQNNLILAGGGTRGTLYATYRFLEDIAEVHWWSPWEESVPSRRVLSIPALNKSGKPVFSYRDIYMLYGNDKGRFAIRNRLNREGDAPIAAEYGGGRDYGPPAHVHTLYDILSNEVYYKDHPDWFLVKDHGVPTRHNSQLNMSNPEMRQEFLKLLRENIRKSHADAKAKGLPAPDMFSVSQMDNVVKFADPNSPSDAKLVAENGGADGAILLDFVNFLADSIKDEFPGVYIDTLAYYSGEKAPTKIRPRDNVVIRLTDTTSNLLQPATDDRNHLFRDNVIAWGKITKNLRVWDYAVTFNYLGLPMPTAFTYPADLRFLRANNVDGIFVEHEFPILSDMRDFKIWMQCKLYEDPYRDYHALVREFTDGFYGPAGVHVRRYIYALQNAVQTDGKANGYEEVTWMTMAKQYSYLSLDFLIKADAMLNDAERAAGANPILQRRVRHARLSLDRYMSLYHGDLATQWIKRGKKPESFPLDLTKISTRALQSWNEQIDFRLPEAEREAERIVAAAQLKNLKYLKAASTPARFRDIPEKDIKLFSMGATRNWANTAKIVEEPESEVGMAVRLLLDEAPEAERPKYGLPMVWGVYDIGGHKERLSTSLKAEEITGPGYHWYKVGETSLGGEDYMFFTWSWGIHLDLAGAFDKKKPDQVYEIWADVKFEGPLYPHGKADAKNAISVDRVALIRK
jgi:hypothetical protein